MHAHMVYKRLTSIYNHAVPIKYDLFEYTNTAMLSATQFTTRNPKMNEKRHRNIRFAYFTSEALVMLVWVAQIHILPPISSQLDFIESVSASTESTRSKRRAFRVPYIQRIEVYLTLIVGTLGPMSRYIIVHSSNAIRHNLQLSWYVIKPRFISRNNNY